MAFAPTAIRTASIGSLFSRIFKSPGSKASTPRRRPALQSTQRPQRKKHIVQPVSRKSLPSVLRPATERSKVHQAKVDQLQAAKRRRQLREVELARARLDAERPRKITQKILRLPPIEERLASSEKPFYRIVRGRKRIVKWSSTVVPKPGSQHALRVSRTRPPQITLPPVPSAVIDKFTTNELTKLDPGGVRTRLFSKKVKEAIRVGDIIQVRFKDPNQEAFSGVLLNIRRRGLDSGILLRNEVTRIAVEMWYKIYSPLIEGFDLVQKRAKRARRAKLYFMRKEKHDIGSVDGIVRNWKRSKTLFADQGGSFKKPGQGTFKKKQYKPAAPAVKA